MPKIQIVSPTPSRDQSPYRRPDDTHNQNHLSRIDERISNLRKDPEFSKRLTFKPQQKFAPPITFEIADPSLNFAIFYVNQKGMHRVFAENLGCAKDVALDYAACRESPNANWKKQGLEISKFIPTDMQNGFVKYGVMLSNGHLPAFPYILERQQTFYE